MTYRQKKENPQTADFLEERAGRGGSEKTPQGRSLVFDSTASQLSHGWPYPCTRPATESGSAGAGGCMGRAAALAVVLWGRFDFILTAAMTVSPYGNHGENN